MKWSITLICGVSVGFVLSGFTGCTGPGRTSIMPNPDKSLRKSSAQFAADAAKRHPYKSDVPRGGEAAARAQVGYAADVLEIVNLSDEDWEDVEVWVNGSYVVHAPRMEKGVLKRFTFHMLYDENGNFLPTDFRKTRVETVELYRDGRIYEVRVQLAD